MYALLAAALLVSVPSYGIWYELRCLRLGCKAAFCKPPAEPFQEYKF